MACATALCICVYLSAHLFIHSRLMPFWPISRNLPVLPASSQFPSSSICSFSMLMPDLTNFGHTAKRPVLVLEKRIHGSRGLLIALSIIETKPIQIWIYSIDKYHVIWLCILTISRRWHSFEISFFHEKAKTEGLKHYIWYGGTLPYNTYHGPFGINSNISWKILEEKADKNLC